MSIGQAVGSIADTVAERGSHIVSPESESSAASCLNSHRRSELMTVRTKEISALQPDDRTRIRMHCTDTELLRQTCAWVPPGSIRRQGRIQRWKRTMTTSGLFLLTYAAGRLWRENQSQRAEAIFSRGCLFTSGFPEHVQTPRPPQCRPWSRGTGQAPSDRRVIVDVGRP